MYNGDFNENYDCFIVLIVSYGIAHTAGLLYSQFQSKPHSCAAQ